MSQELDAWLRAFSRAVRDRDFASGKSLFDAGVVSFGTVCSRADTLDELQANQWQFIWPNTRDFDFEYAEAATLVEGDQAVIVAGWSSTGFKVDGAPFQRRGRATIVLRRQLSEWKAVHTHFSLEPVLKP